MSWSAEKERAAKVGGLTVSIRSVARELVAVAVRIQSGAMEGAPSIADIAEMGECERHLRGHLEDLEKFVEPN